MFGHIAVATIVTTLLVPFQITEARSATLCGRSFVTGQDLLKSLAASGATLERNDETMLRLSDKNTMTIWTFVKTTQVAAGVYCQKVHREGDAIKVKTEVACNESQMACEGFAKSLSLPARNPPKT